MAGKTTGVYQLSNGLWAFRYTVSMNGKKKDVKKTKDESGKPFKTEKAAFRARESAIARELHSRTSKPQIPRMMMCEVYKEYCEQGRSGKAYQTILIQDKMNNIVTAGDAKTVSTTNPQVIDNTVLGAAEELKNYKELLDNGVITQEEFDAKKTQLLGL